MAQFNVHTEVHAAAVVGCTKRSESEWVCDIYSRETLNNTHAPREAVEPDEVATVSGAELFDGRLSKDGNIDEVLTTDIDYDLLARIGPGGGGDPISCQIVSRADIDSPSKHVFCAGQSRLK